jgi:hypothetical protein
MKLFPTVLCNACDRHFYHLIRSWTALANRTGLKRKFISHNLDILICVEIQVRDGGRVRPKPVICLK